MWKAATYYILAVLAVLIIWLLYHDLTTGTIIVTTNSADNSISLFKIAPDEQKSITSNAQQRLSIRVHPGDYLIKVSSKSFSTNKIIHVKARKTFSYAINPVSLTALEPVLPSGASSLVADSSSLLYIQPGNNLLYRIDAQNNDQPVDSTHSFLSIKWINNSFGIGKGEDEKLYSINAGTITQIPLPFDTNDKKPVYFVVSDNKEVFVTHGPDVYAGTAAGNFKKIYTAKSPVPSLAALGNKVAVLEAPGDVTNKDVPPAITLVDKTGKVLIQKPVESNFGNWSKDGKYLLVTDDSPGGVIVDGSLDKVATLPPSAISSSVWMDDRLYYTTAGQLWSYDVPTQTSQLVASMPASVLTDVTLSADNGYIYLTVTPNSNTDGTKIYRFSLRGQKVPNYVYQLPIILPDNSQPACSLSFVNFTRPTIVGGGANPAQNCPAAIQAVFAPYGIDTSFMGVQYIQPNGNETE